MIPRAVEVGMAVRLFSDETVLRETLAKACEMAQWPVRALQEIKRTLMVPHRVGIAAALEVENAGVAKLAGSPENVEAITAFLEKRPPDFKKFRSWPPQGGASGRVASPDPQPSKARPGPVGYCPGIAELNLGLPLTERDIGIQWASLSVGHCPGIAKQNLGLPLTKRDIGIQ